MQNDTGLFPEVVRLRTPRGLRAALEIAARRRHTTPAEWARQALIRSLEADGIQLCSDRAAVQEHVR